MYWKLYFWIITSLVIFSYVSGGINDIWDAIDVSISIGGFVGLFGYAYKKNILNQQFWKIYFPTYLIWDLTNNFIIYPLKTGEEFEIIFLLVLPLFFPIYIALYRYTYFNFIDEERGESHVSQNNEKNGDESEIEYPSILRRYLATVIDGSLIIIALFFASYLFQQNEGVSKVVRVAFLVAMFLVYEPLCTSKFCTIGQKIMQIRIRSSGSYERISIFSAYVRIVTKLFLGIISFFSIPFTKGKRALHDFAVNSIVIYVHQNKG